MPLRNVDLPVRHLWIVSCVFLCVHGFLIIHNIVIPDAFLRGDRSSQRMEKIQYVFLLSENDQTFKNLNVKIDPQSSFANRVLALGNMGDYFIHALFYSIGGSILIVLVQVFLSFLATVCVYRLALLLLLPPLLAMVATVLYLLLPGSLMQPHMLVTEGLYNPLVVFAFYFIVRCVEEDKRHIFVICGMMMLGAAIYVRFELAMYPVLLATIFMYFMPREWCTRALPSILICFVGPIGWYLFAHTQGAPSVPDDRLGAILFEKATRLAVIGDFAVDPSAYPNNEMALTEFIAFVIRHPKELVLSVGYELVNLFLNPGVNHFAAIYLKLINTSHGGLFYWADLRDEGGYWGLFKGIVSLGPAFAISVIVSTLLWGVVILVSAVGFVKFIANRTVAPITRAILVSYLVYGSVVVLIVRNTRWAYRTHVEFIIVLLFAFGIAALIEWRNRRQTLV